MPPPTPQQEQANIEAAVARGIPRATIMTWLASHPGDSGRIATAFPTPIQPPIQPPTQPPVQPPTQPPVISPTQPPITAPVSSATGAVTSNMRQTQPDVSMGGGGGGPVSLPGAGSLRQRLGQRIYPDESGPLAGLRKAY